MQKSSPKHMRRETARMKEDKEKEEDDKQTGVKKLKKSGQEIRTKSQGSAAAQVHRNLWVLLAEAADESPTEPYTKCIDAPLKGANM